MALMKTHCISSNVEYVILYKTALWTAKKGILDCQHAHVGNRECSIYVLHRHFDNMELFVNQIGCLRLPLIRCGKGADGISLNTAAERALQSCLLLSMYLLV